MPPTRVIRPVARKIIPMRLRESLPYVALVAALAATSAVAWWANARTRAEANLRFDRLISRKVGDLYGRMGHYEDYLRGAGGLFAASPEVTQGQWQAYTRTLNLGQDADVLAAFGFSEVIDSSALPAHLAAMRRAHPDYRVLPEPAPGSRRLAPVTLLRVLDGQAPEAVRLGADQLADPARAQAMERALRSRAAALTARLPGAGGGAPSLQMYFPAYRGDRLLGYVHLLFRADALAAAVARGDLSDVAVSLYDGAAAGPANLLYRDPQAGRAAQLRKTLVIEVAGHPWTMDFASTPELEARSTERLPQAILAVGGVGSLLLFALVWSLARTSRRAEAIAERTTRALSDQMQLNEDLIELNPNPIIRKDLQGHYVQFNRAWERMTGRSRADWLGKTAYELTPPEVAARHAQSDRLLLEQPDTIVREEGTVTAADGRVYEVIISKSAIRRADGTLAGIIGTITDLSEINRLTDELAAQREQLELVNLSAQAGVWDRQLPDGHAYLSPRFYEMLGYAPGTDLLAQMIEGALVHPDDRARVLAERESHFARRTATFRCDFRLRRADGGYLWVTGSGLATFDPAGTPVRFTGSIVDISARKAAQAEIERQRELLELVSQSAQGGVWDRLLPDGPTYLSPRFYEMLGYTDSDDLLRRFGTGHLVHPDDRERMIAVRDAHFSHLSPNFDCEYRMRRGDGSYLWVNGRGVASFDRAGPQGRAVRFTGSVIDISARKAAQAEIEHQRAQLELVVESSRAGVWDTDLVKGETALSPRYLEILGMPPGSAAASTARLGERAHPDDAAQVEEARTAAIASGGLFGQEFRMRREDGSYVWINARGKVVLDAQGRAVRFTGAIIDIDARKQTEAALLAANAAAIEAARAKSTFLATMSHEIRTPLNGVIGSAGLLVDTRLNPEQREYVETISSSGNQLLALINDILDFSKIESGQMELEDAPFDVGRVIEDAFEVVAERARAKRLELLADLMPHTPRWVRGDVTRVRQVLINLVANAVKFTDAGEVCVTVRADPANQPAQSGQAPALLLEFSVSDTGIGIPADKRDRLFTAFTQVDASTTRKYGGTGLGLAICRRLVDLMGGGIRAEAAPGGGACFVFTIRTRAAQAPRAQREDAGSIAGKRVLVVDDYPANRRIFRGQCASWG